MTEAIKKAVGILGGQKALADALGVKQPTVSQWVSGKKKVPLTRLRGIEDATCGLVTRKELRPDLAEIFQ